MATVSNQTKLISRELTSLEDDLLEYIRKHPGLNTEAISNSDAFAHYDLFLIAYSIRFLLSESLIKEKNGDALYWRQQAQQRT